MKLIDGKETAKTINAETADVVADLGKNHNLKPGLAVVIVGDDPASHVYVRNKVRTSGQLGIHSERIELPATTSQSELLALVARLNEDDAIHGILVQSPLPNGIDEQAVVDAINPQKDVDCFHPINVGAMTLGRGDSFLPCTPWGVMVLLERYGIETAGKHAVVVGRSNIVGKPLALLLAQKQAHANCTVTICHSGTSDIAAFTRNADILVAAMGRPEAITGDMVKEDAVVIDVGVNRVEDSSRKSGYRLTGDVHFDSAAEKASWITPVPGGVGPMTIAMLMRNAVIASCRHAAIPVPDLLLH